MPKIKSKVCFIQVLLMLKTFKISIYMNVAVFLLGLSLLGVLAVSWQYLIKKKRLGFESD